MSGLYSAHFEASVCAYLLCRMATSVWHSHGVVLAYFLAQEHPIQPRRLLLKQSEMN